MSEKIVYSIRIPVRIRRLMEEMPEYRWQEEITAIVEETVRKKRREQLLAKARMLHPQQRKDRPAAELIREDRDAR
jgi:cysteine synthase